MAKTNKEIVDCLENDAVIAAWDKGEDDSDLDCKVVRCKDCIHHELYPDTGCRNDWVHCVTYDTFKRLDGFCELGTIKRGKLIRAKKWKGLI